MNNTRLFGVFVEAILPFAMSKKTENRFCFMLVSEDKELDDFVGFMFSCFAQQKITGDLTKRIASCLKDMVRIPMNTSQSSMVEAGVLFREGKWTRQFVTYPASLCALCSSSPGTTRGIAAS